MGGRIPWGPWNGPRTFYFSVSLRWLTGSKITISGAQASASLLVQCTFVHENSILGLKHPQQTSLFKLIRVKSRWRWRLQQHTDLILSIVSHLYIYVATCPHLIGVMGLTHLPLALREINCFHDFPTEFAFKFFIFKVGLKVLLLSSFSQLWPLSPPCHSSSSVWF